MRIAFVGPGRVCQALAPALAEVGHDVTVAGRHGGPPAWVSAPLQWASRAAAVDAVELVFLTVPDDAIAAIAAELPWQPGVSAIHCSGALGPEVLRSAEEHGAATGCFHPLQTFAGGPAPLDGVTVAMEGDASLAGVLSELARELGCKPLTLPPGRRAQYHAAAVFAGNYLVTLLAAASRLWADLGVDEARALQALAPLVHTTAANVERLGPRVALTGPIARGDAGSIERHLAAIEGAAPDLAGLYRQLGLATLPLTTLPDANRRQLENILQGASTPCA